MRWWTSSTLHLVTCRDLWSLSGAFTCTVHCALYTPAHQHIAHEMFLIFRQKFLKLVK